MGTPEFGAPVLESLINSKEHDIVAVYTQPPRPANRGKKLSYSPIYRLANKYNLKIYTPLNFKNTQDIGEFKAIKADIAIVAAYGLLLPEEILSAPQYGCINIHSSLLPRWRGAAPINRAIMAGDKISGITIMQMDEGLDTGDIIRQASIDISDKMDAAMLHDELSNMAPPIIHDILRNINNLTPTKQNEALATYAQKLDKSEGLINWSDAIVKLDCQIRGLQPRPGAYFIYNNEKFKIIKASFIKKQHQEIVGTILNNKLHIACCQLSNPDDCGIMESEIIQRQGKKAMNVKDFINGFTIPVGYVLE